MALMYLLTVLTVLVSLSFDRCEAQADLLGSTYFHLVMKVDSYILPFLNYSTMMLEPHLDAKGIENHFEGHHEQYRRKMNSVLHEWREEQPESELARESILTILQKIGSVPKKFRQQLRNVGGGYVNHCFYFGIMSPNLESEKREPTGYLQDELSATFGGFEEFQKAFEDEAAQVFGSGYVWLVRNPKGLLEIQTLQNEDSPMSKGAFFPVIVLDLWEHAYQTKHIFRRQDYVRDWWNVLDWDKVEKLDQWGKELVYKQKEQEEASKNKEEL